MRIAVSLTVLMHQVEHIAFGDMKHSFAAWYPGKRQGHWVRTSMANTKQNATACTAQRAHYTTQQSTPSTNYLAAQMEKPGPPRVYTLTTAGVKPKFIERQLLT